MLAILDFYERTLCMGLEGINEKSRLVNSNRRSHECIWRLPWFICQPRRVGTKKRLASQRPRWSNLSSNGSSLTVPPGSCQTGGSYKTVLNYIDLYWCSRRKIFRTPRVIGDCCGLLEVHSVPRRVPFKINNMLSKSGSASSLLSG